MCSPLQYKIALSLLPKIGGINARKLVAYAGSIEAIFNANPRDLKGIPGIGSGLVKQILENRETALEKAFSEEVYIKKHRLKTFFYLDPEYPRRLAQCSDAPTILFMKGDADLNTSIMVSIVGTRKATENGRQLTIELVSGIKRKGLNPIIVSGLAYGIDISAHKAALLNQLPTIGVVGHGLDTLYPSSHASVAREMTESNGALVSDFPSESKIDPGNFIRRNRIIAGLSDCTIVVESAEKGGALVTADIAGSYNRDVFAFPGRPDDQYSKGCNRLIKENKAALIESADDLINYMGWEILKTPVQKNLMLEFTEHEETIVKLLMERDVSTSDTLARATDLSMNQISSILLELEFKGLVKSLPGNRFKLIHSSF